MAEVKSRTAFSRRTIRNIKLNVLGLSLSVEMRGDNCYTWSQSTGFA